MKRITTLLAGLLLSAASHAEVAECYSWQPDAGKTAATLQTMQEAAAIHEKLGAAVGIYQINVGGSHVDYCMRWDNIMAWGASKDQMIFIIHSPSMFPVYYTSTRARARTKFGG